MFNCNKNSQDKSDKNPFFVPTLTNAVALPTSLGGYIYCISNDIPLVAQVIICIVFLLSCASTLISVVFKLIIEYQNSKSRRRITEKITAANIQILKDESKDFCSTNKTDYLELQKEVIKQARGMPASTVQVLINGIITLYNSRGYPHAFLTEIPESEFNDYSSPTAPSCDRKVVPFNNSNQKEN